jgi:hypothetical protein
MFTASIQCNYAVVAFCPYLIRTTHFLHLMPVIPQSRSFRSAVLRICVPPQGHGNPATATNLSIIVGKDIHVKNLRLSIADSVSLFFGKNVDGIDSSHSHSHCLPPRRQVVRQTKLVLSPVPSATRMFRSAAAGVETIRSPTRTVKMRDELQKLDRGGDMDPLLV